MGWWRIDPETGMPEKDARSKLSRPPDFALLNAVPGVDDDADASYMGDGPWNVAEDMVRDIAAAIGSRQLLSEEEARQLFLESRVPERLGDEPLVASRLLQITHQLWHYVDECYMDDWDRPPRSAERRWVAEHAVECLMGQGENKSSL